MPPRRTIALLCRLWKFPSLAKEGWRAAPGWFDRGDSTTQIGSLYIGIGGTGALLASQMSLFAFTAKSYPGTLDSAIRVDYNTSDPVGSGFGPEGYGFANGTRTFGGLGADVQVAAKIHAADFLVSGYWPNWQTSGAAGQPIVIRWASGAQDATLIGLDPIFRGHPEDSFRLVANAIYNGLDPTHP